MNRFSLWYHSVINGANWSISISLFQSVHGPSFGPLSVTTSNRQIPDLCEAHIYDYRMPETYSHINQCNARVQYFAILHSDKYFTLLKKNYKSENAFTFNLCL